MEDPDPAAPAEADASADVVLFHGWACPVGYWRPLRRRLEELGHRSVAPPLPGYGSAAEGGDAELPPGFEWNVETVAGLFATRFAARQQAPLHLVGHSLGGSIAATIAARYPELVASVTLLGMVPTAPSSASRELLSGLFLNRPISDDAIKLCLNSWYGERLPTNRQMTRAPFRIRRDVLDASLLAALDGVEPDVPGRIPVPVQVMIGAEDKTRSLSEVQTYADEHPGTELNVIPGASHMVHWQAAGACAEQIHGLIRR